MKNILLNILLFPTWLLVNILDIFLPITHPWHKRYFSMRDWRLGSTKENYAFSFLFWFNFIVVIYGLIKIFGRL
jgi:hypothetical protein